MRHAGTPLETFYLMVFIPTLHIVISSTSVTLVRPISTPVMVRVCTAVRDKHVTGALTWEMTMIAVVCDQRSTAAVVLGRTGESTKCIFISINVEVTHHFLKLHIIQNDTFHNQITFNANITYCRILIVLWISHCHVSPYGHVSCILMMGCVCEYHTPFQLHVRYLSHKHWLLTHVWPYQLNLTDSSGCLCHGYAPPHSGRGAYMYAYPCIHVSWFQMITEQLRVWLTYEGL